MKYRADIDGMRAVAVVSVIVFHMVPALLPGGFAGVDVFFVISGFVVAASLASARQPTLGAFIASFYARRLARITPALVVMLTLTAFATALFIPQAWLSRFNLTTELAAFLGISNWVLEHNADRYFAPVAEFNPFTHTWSLGVEEQFYLVCPLLLFAVARARSVATGWLSRVPLQLLGIIGVASLVGCAWASTAHPDAAFYSIVFRFWELAAGVLLFQLTTVSTPDEAEVSVAARAAPWIGLLLIGVTMAFATPLHFPFPWAIPAVAGTLCLLGGTGAPLTGRVRRVLATAVPVWIGKRSYSLYLWHWPVLVLMRWTVGLDTWPWRSVALLITVAASVASYRLVEIPLRHNRRIEALRPAFQVALFLVGVLLVRTALKREAWRATTISLSTVNQHLADWYPEDRMVPDPSAAGRCTVAFRIAKLDGGEVRSYTPSACSAGVATHTLDVIGDSHAMMYLPMFDRYSMETGTAVRVYSLAACAYIDFLAPMAGGRTPECLAFLHDAEQSVRATARPGDVLFLPGLRQWKFGDQWGLYPGRNVDSLALGAAGLTLTARARDEAIEWIRPFVSRGMVVVLEAPTPIFRSPAYRCSDWFNARNPVCAGGLTVSRDYLRRLRTPVVDAMHAVAASLGGTRIWDPFDLLCPAEACEARRNGRPLFSDGDHLSGFSNTLVYPSFRELMLTL